MPREASPEVNPNTVSKLCAHLVTVLANNSALSEDQVFSALGKLKAGTLLAMFCVIRFWALDTFARLSGIGSVSEWGKKFEVNLHLPKVSQSDLLDLASRTQDETSLLLLTIAFDALRMMAIVIERKLDSLPVGKKYVRFRDAESEENLENILQTISPRPSYYRIRGERLEERRSDIRAEFLEFINKPKRTPVGNWKDIPHAALADHRPAPHPEWDQQAREFLSREIEEALKSDLPILDGRVENVSLQVKTALRDKYKSLFPQITFKTTGETVKPRNFDLEKITPEKLHEIGGHLNPEILFNAEQSKTKQAALIDSIKKFDPQLFWALMKNRTKNRVNKTKAARDLEISRPALDERIEQLVTHIANEHGKNRQYLEKMIKEILD